MSGFVQKLLIVSGVMVVMTGLFIFLFVQSIVPEKEDEDRVLRETKSYIAEHFKDAEVPGVLYDNMGNYFTLDYAVQLYRDAQVLPFITFTLNRYRVPNEEENLARVATALQTKKILQHGNLRTEYVNDQGVTREGSRFQQTFLNQTET
ncbi:hypothetical protein [Exiguobacterium sp. S22-S28]|uniref:hypothetical protein n=1 Tax=Exiguobacterium sp. S22-S28 TaxID=3342768 RepID=UPI00372D6040